ncbi:MAG: hypothetical protein KF891_11905 [Rhizobacter sp.]|nr:hypothetical protein [Rhizobacter sp.]
MHTHEVPARRVAWVGAVMACTVVGVVAAVLGWLHLRGLPPGGQRLDAFHAPPITGPMLQSAPQRDLKPLLDDKTRRLRALGWVPGERDIAHIPIDDAMALLVQRAASAPEADR